MLLFYFLPTFCCLIWRLEAFCNSIKKARLPHGRVGISLSQPSNVGMRSFHHGSIIPFFKRYKMNNNNWSGVQIRNVLSILTLFPSGKDTFYHHEIWQNLVGIGLILFQLGFVRHYTVTMIKDILSKLK